MARIRKGESFRRGRWGDVLPEVSAKSKRVEGKLPPSGRQCIKCGGPVSRYARTSTCSRCLERSGGRGHR